MKLPQFDRRVWVLLEGLRQAERAGDLRVAPERLRRQPVGHVARRGGGWTTVRGRIPVSEKDSAARDQYCGATGVSTY